MKFQSRICGYPIYLLAENQPAPTMNTYLKLTQHPQLTQIKSSNLTNAKIWFQVQKKAPFTNVMFTNPKLAVSSYDRDSSLFNIELTNGRKVGDEFQYDCTAELDNNWVRFDQNGLVLSQIPASFVISTSCGDNVENGGNFYITDGVGNYGLLTKDTSQYPVLGVTNKKEKASVYTFSWTGYKSLRSLITIFLKTRYFLDHPNCLHNKDKIDDLRQIYSDVGQIIIKQIIGNRKEATYYRDYQDRMDNKEGFGPTYNYQKTFDSSYKPCVGIDDYRQIYPPYAISPYVTLPFDNFEDYGNVENYSHADSFIAGAPSTTVNQGSNNGVDYQRSVTYESSDAALDTVSYDSVLDAGIVANAEKVLLQIATQPLAWDKIKQAVSPIGSDLNSWPALLIVKKDAIGVNLLHPVFAGSMLGTDPLFYHCKNDGNTRERPATGVYIMKESDNTLINSKSAVDDIPEKGSNLDTGSGQEVEHLCPCGDGGKNNGQGSAGFPNLYFVILFLFIVIVAMTCHECFNGNQSFSAPIISTISTSPTSVI